MVLFFFYFPLKVAGHTFIVAGRHPLLVLLNDSPGSVLNGGKLWGAAWPVSVLAMWRPQFKFCSPTFKFSTMHVNS